MTELRNTTRTHYAIARQRGDDLWISSVEAQRRDNLEEIQEIVDCWNNELADYPSDYFIVRVTKTEKVERFTSEKESKFKVGDKVRATFDDAAGILTLLRPSSYGLKWRASPAWEVDYKASLGGSGILFEHEMTPID